MNPQSVFVLVLLGVAFVAALRKGKKHANAAAAGTARPARTNANRKHAAIANRFAMAAFF